MLVWASSRRKLTDSRLCVLQIVTRLHSVNGVLTGWEFSISLCSRHPEHGEERRAEEKRGNLLARSEQTFSQLKSCLTQIMNQILLWKSMWSKQSRCIFLWSVGKDWVSRREELTFIGLWKTFDRVTPNKAVTASGSIDFSVAYDCNLKNSPSVGS